MARAPSLKPKAFKEECEWRLVALPMDPNKLDTVRFNDGKRGVVPYVEISLAEEGDRIPLTRLYVGPTQDDKTGLNGAQTLLKHHGYDPGLACPSGIPFRG